MHVNLVQIKRKTNLEVLELFFRVIGILTPKVYTKTNFGTYNF